MLERYGHGGDLQSASELYDIEQDQLLDFSSNMNPLGPPQVVADILSQYMQHITNYPDPANRQLRETIAKKHLVHTDQVIVGNGAAELIDLIIRYIKPKTAAIVAPSFIEYEQALQKIDCKITYIESHADHGFSPNEQQVEQLIEQQMVELYMLGHPNNPTGQLLSEKMVTNLLQSGAIVVLDEAFLDFHLDEDGLSWISKVNTYRNLFVIRSMTKFYSIPGIRLGYMIGAAEQLELMKQMQYPWSVNSLAQFIGHAVLQDHSFANQSKSWLVEEVNWMYEQLVALHVKPFRTVTNYILVDLSYGYDISASELQQLMGMQGVLIRDASTFKGLESSYIRLAIKSRQQNIQCLTVLSTILSKYRKDVVDEL
ncbi:MAG: threonine-phosphate decarboxylase CobD [Candidatus Pristimantibacillus lignocellulolyticus]|uniref:threonine-phosphate decarboxylase n=1 Tax=Candidatus Pristimantibacillus lignocellulolyticus TaxID=2994561 RepID=A0A9J6ZBY6_9BACL|nr:MAG: threonine-phosphate decarboxylase CobD [Candidatus Pristimantibacillus lignocellulolyticus]